MIKEVKNNRIESSNLFSIFKKKDIQIGASKNIDKKLLKKQIIIVVIFAIILCGLIAGTGYCIWAVKEKLNDLNASNIYEQTQYIINSILLKIY